MGGVDTHLIQAVAPWGEYKGMDMGQGVEIYKEDLNLIVNALLP